MNPSQSTIRIQPSRVFTTFLFLFLSSARTVVVVVVNSLSTTSTTSSTMPSLSNHRRAWFKSVFGFSEPQDYDRVRQVFDCQTTEPNGDMMLQTNHPRLKQQRHFFVGTFDTPSLGELRQRIDELSKSSPNNGNGNANNNNDNNNKSTATTNLTFQHIADDAADLHFDPDHHGCLIQAASQFNCLEMTSPRVTPRDGITDYALDATQGPACALACPAATLYRNYFWNETGQGHDEQIDTLSDLEHMVVTFAQQQQKQSSSKSTTATTASRPSSYWNMKNGYALPTLRGSMHDLRTNVLEHPDFDLAKAAAAVRVGVHWETQVDDMDPQHHRVGQVYASALPLGYDPYRSAVDDWEPLARLILNAAYECTLAAAVVLARQRGKRVKVFLTKLGGGVFRNPDSWIGAAIVQALTKFRDEPLDVYLVHYQYIDSFYVDFMEEYGPSFLSSSSSPKK